MVYFYGRGLVDGMHVKDCYMASVKEEKEKELMNK